jgi:chemotaxis protein methyltransferase CheR
VNIELIKAPADTALHPHLVLAKLERLLGLRYLPHQWTDLLRVLKPAASELRFPDVHRCLAWLEHEEQTTEHVHILARHLTIGESYFFREIVLFSLLRDTIVPNILRRKSETGDSLLRVWSAGCSTGEEAYSLAIVIASMLPDDSPMRVQILGTDVNPTAVQRARQGEYREWSFRDMSPGLKDMWFDVDGEQRYTVKERLRSMTHFETLNLIDAHNFPLQMDIILCRNVLMYFTRQVVQDIVTGFKRSLRPDGWLAPSLTETTLINLPGLEGVRFGEVTVFRHQKRELPCFHGGGARQPTGSVETVMPEKPAHAPAHPFDELLPERVLGERAARNDVLSAMEDLLSAAMPVQSAGEFENLLEDTELTVPNDTDMQPRTVPSHADAAKALADAGRLEDALIAAEQAVDQDKMCAYNQYLLATILRELGETQRALQAFERALYLDPDSIAAHFGLGSLYRFLGMQEKATRHLANALQLIDALPEQDGLLEWSGMTAVRLAQEIRAVDEARL